MTKNYKVEEEIKPQDDKQKEEEEDLEKEKKLIEKLAGGWYTWS